MNHETAWRVLWCLWFACVMGGPYLLGVQGDIKLASASGTYTFVALGFCVGMWLTSSSDDMAILFKRATIWKACLGTGIAFALLMIGLGLFESGYVRSFGSPAVPIFSAMGPTLPLRPLVDVVEAYEKPLAFFDAFLCGATSVSWKDEQVHPAHKKLGPNGFILCAIFLAGMLRLVGWGALFSTGFGVVLLWGGLFEWAFCMTRCRVVRGCVAVFCLGEFAFRLLTRCVTLPTIIGYGVADFALISFTVCMGGGMILSLCVSNDIAELDTDKGSSGVSQADGLEDWERERLREAGLTSRELDVFEALASGCTPLEAAHNLGMQPSTVRTYKGRICKRLRVFSFDQLIGERLARKGLFRVPESMHGNSIAGEEHSTLNRRVLTLAILRFSGCATSMILLLMPFGVLPAFWNSIWVMAYGCAAGIMVGSLPIWMRCFATCAHLGFIHVRIPSVLFLLFATVCFLLRMYMELAATGFGQTYRIALMIVVMGFVCFGLVELRSSIEVIMHMRRGATGVGLVIAALLFTISACFSLAWYVAMVIALLMSASGLMLNPRADGMGGFDACTHPAVAASWFAVAFYWEECWRGINHASLQDVGIAFLGALVFLDAVALFKRDKQSCVLVVVALICTACVCLARGFAFGLLFGVILFEIQVAAERALPQRTSQNGAGIPCLIGAAVGCCAAVYVSNARGVNTLQHVFSVSVSDLDWTSLCCFAISLGIVSCRAFFVPSSVPLGDTVMGEYRLRGYLVGKGLTETEVNVCAALARGESISQIAEAMSYSLSMTGALKRTAFAKLGVDTKRQFMATLRREFIPNQSSTLKNSR